MKRRPGIRHLRYFWLSWRVHRWAYECAHRYGFGLGYPNPSDLHWLQLIWEGKA